MLLYKNRVQYLIIFEKFFLISLIIFFFIYNLNYLFSKK